MDWENECPMEVVGKIAGLAGEFHAMRMMCTTWKIAADWSVHGLDIGPEDPPLPPNASERFFALVKLSIGGWKSETELTAGVGIISQFRNLRTVILDGCSEHVQDSHLRQLFKPPLINNLTGVSLAGCTKVKIACTNLK